MLLYLVEMGDAAQNIVKQAVRFRQPIPDRIKDAPELKHGLMLYFQAFIDLDFERPEGFNGIRAIPGSVVRAYAKDYGFSVDQTERLTYYVRKMDSAYLQLKNKSPGS